MNRLSHKAHNSMGLTIFFFTLILLFLLSRSMTSTADATAQGGWRVEVEEGESARSTLTINNRCSTSHLFRIKSKAKFLQFEQPTDSVLIEASSSKQLVVRLDARGLKSKIYSGKVEVECIDCKKEAGCNQNRDELPVEMIVKSYQPATPLKPGSLKGRVVDPRNNPVGGVEVRIHGRAAMFTDSRGEFNIRDVAPSERLAVSFSAKGFMDTTRIYNTARASIGTSVVIWPRAAAASLDADRGGKLTFPGGTVNFPARSLVDEQGRAISGKVNVSFSTLNVADGAQIRSAPGDFTARMPDNRIRQLETFGVFEVYVEDSCGRRVNLAPGQNATVELSIPQEIRRRTPSSVGLFSFDQNSGRWIPEGTLRLLPTRPFLTTPIRNVVVTWNADMLMDTTCLRVQVLDANNQPAPQGIRVEAEGFNYTGISPTSYTDASGVACLLVKKSAQAIVTAYDPNAPDIQSCPETFQTSNTTLDCSNPSLCPMGTPSIKISGGYFLDELNSYDTTRWYESNGTNYDPNDPTNPFNVCWDPTHISFSCCPSLMTIALDNTTCSLANHNLPYTSGEYQTRACYYYGKYEASIKAAKGGGLVTSFFTYTGPPMTAGHHEIDIEIKGNQDTGCPGGQTRTVMQANYYVKGVGNHEVPIDLCFDASAAFHTYAFEWRPNMIQWSVDGVVKYTVCNTSQCPSGGVIMTGPLPSLPGKIIVNFWAGNSNANAWLGGPFVYPGAPIQAQYDWIKYSP